MYELPPKFNTALTNSSYNQPVPQPKTIPGLAPLFSGLHDTDQFSLDRIFYDRMRLEATKLLKPEECKLFYVPYFSQWETWHVDRVNGKWVDVDRAQLNSEVLPLLTHMGRFRKPTGADHFLTISRVERDCDVLLKNDAFKHVKKLGIETLLSGGDPLLFAVPYPAWFRYSKSMAPEPKNKAPTVVVTSAHFHAAQTAKCSDLSDSAALKALEQTCKGKSSCAVQAPVSIHGCTMAHIHGKYKCSDSNAEFSFSANVEEYPTYDGATASLGCTRGPCWLSGNCQKPYYSKERTGPLVAFIGSAKPHEMERLTMIQHCRLRPELCVFLDTSQSGFKLDNAMITKMDDLLMSSVFCFNPPGDTPTRKGLFDSLLAGCIPVIFDDATLSLYKWYIPNVEEVSVFLPAFTSQSFNIVDMLAGGSAVDVRKLQDAIARIAFSLQYSEEPTSKGDPGDRDAFDIAIDGLLALSDQKKDQK